MQGLFETVQTVYSKNQSQKIQNDANATQRLKQLPNNNIHTMQFRH